MNAPVPPMVASNACTASRAEFESGTVPIRCSPWPPATLTTNYPVLEHDIEADENAAANVEALTGKRRVPTVVIGDDILVEPSNDELDAWDRAEDGTVNSLQAEFDSWNPRLSLSYKPSADTTFYASAARGFRSGQLQPIGSILLAQLYDIDLPSEIAPDSIMTYELGVKSLFAEGRLLLEAALFSSRWKDVAVRVPITDQINGLANSDGTRNVGVEANLVYNPSRNLTLQLGGSWIDATYSADVPDTPLFKGTPVYNVPKTSITTSASYRWDIGESLRGSAFVSAHHDSARKTSLTAGSPGDPITLANLRVGVESPTGWSAYLYGNNLTNEDGAINARNLSLAANRPQPRTWGVLFRYDY